MSVTLHVRRGRFVPAHDRFEAHSASHLELDTGRTYTSLSSGFRCACGAQMHDGDPFVEDERTGAVAHERCAHLLKRATCPNCGARLKGATDWLDPPNENVEDTACPACGHDVPFPA